VHLILLLSYHQACVIAHIILIALYIEELTLADAPCDGDKFKVQEILWVKWKSVSGRCVPACEPNGSGVNWYYITPRPHQFRLHVMRHSAGEVSLNITQQ
jgi:hypothetical protein